MAITYDVRAYVVDIRVDTPRAGDCFLVDTCAWLVLTYTKASFPAPPHQKRFYPHYISKAKAAGSTLLRSGFSFAELSHTIEDAERNAYNEEHMTKLGPKEFRHNYPTERSKVVDEIRIAWGQAKTFADPLESVLDEATTDAALNRCSTQPLDGYDLFLLEALGAAHVPQVITDDGDFSTVPGIVVFTANRNVIDQAAASGRLLAR